MPTPDSMEKPVTTVTLFTYVSDAQEGTSAPEVRQAADRWHGCDVITIHAELHHALCHDRSV